MRTLAALDSPISSLLVSPDGSTVITASGESIAFLDLASGNRRVTPLADDVRRLAWGPDGLLAGTSSGEVWTVGTRPERLVEALDEEISGIAVAHDGTIAVCGGEPFAVATFGRYGNEEWRGEPYKWPYCVRLSPDGKELVIGTWDGNLFVLDTTDLPDDLGSLDTEYAGGPIFDAQFLPDGNVLVAGARFVRIWDRATSRYAQTRELDAEAFAIAVAPDGSCAVASTNDQRLRLFALPGLEEIGELAMGRRDAKPRSYFPDYAEFCNVKGPATIRALAFHPDGARIFASTEDGRLLEVGRSDLRGARKAAGTAPPAQRVAPPAQLSLPLPPPAPAAPRATKAAAKASATTRAPSKPAKAPTAAASKAAATAAPRAAAKAAPRAAAKAAPRAAAKTPAKKPATAAARKAAAAKSATAARKPVHPAARPTRKPATKKTNTVSAARTMSRKPTRGRRR